MRGILKRKFAQVDDNPCYSSSSSSSSPPSSLSSPASSEWESDGESGPPDNQDFSPHGPSSPAGLPVRSILRRREFAATRGNVRFDQVTVFSFPRCQGFTSVPSHGGATLGMTQQHVALQRYTVAEHVLEQPHRRRERLRERRRAEKVEALKHNWITSGACDERDADGLATDQIPAEDADVQIGDADLEDGGSLLPYSSRQRQALLQAAGVKRVDREEKRQLHALRVSREACGCDCRGFCEPETCACSLAGIRCQVDRFNFPCGCTKDSCGNIEGRLEFNSRRVQTHYLHTAMRLEMERRLQDETLSQTDHPGPPDGPPAYAARDGAHTDKRCAFGFSAEEDGLPLTAPVAPSFHLIPERLVMEENSCSSDMTESSCSSSDSDGGGCLSGSQNLPEVDGSLSRSLSLCDNDSYAVCGQPLTSRGSSPADSLRPPTPDTFTDSMSRTPATDYLDDNANQARDFFDDDSLGGFPDTPSPTVDYSSGYMDLSLSSDSDLELFDSDYASGPLHSSFKLHRHPDSFCQLQLFRSVNLPEHESSTYLLESLIGLTEPSPEQGPLL